MRIRPDVWRNDGAGTAGSGGGSPAPSGGEGGTASPSPSSTPSSTPAPSTSPDASPSPSPSSEPAADPNSLGDGLFSFEGMNDTDGDVEDGVTAPTPAPTPATPPTPAPATPPTPAQPQTPPGAEPAAQPAVPPTPTPAVVPPPGPQDQSPQSYPTEPAQIAQALMQNQDALLEHLATTEFKLSPQDLEALEADAPAHIPKLLARGYFKSQVNMMQQLSTLVPQMVQKQVQVMRSNMENENKFYDRWKQLDRSQHSPIVKKYATLYRQANPSASLEQMVEDLGPVVMMAAKIAPGPQTLAPSAPIVTGMPRPPQAAPFVPALGGPAAPPATPEDDPWGGLAPGAINED